MRAIDADFVKKELIKLLRLWNKEGLDFDVILLGRRIEQIIETVPTLNPSEIVYCQDCAHHWDLNGKQICVKLDCDCPDDSEFFCKFGRKKDGSTTD